ncbi:WecB/TagA/CpsF family glycosyltransferase [Priestia sp. YIM B13448]|uniref:WecB/TagA/CpsF family glycosyltransferase n=1 Tax=Priestia sp. YIM B13448 TaxID=3366308 RepID=UPI00366E87E4
MNSLIKQNEHIETAEVLGASVSLLTIDKLHEMIRVIISNNSKRVIPNHNLHSLYIFNKEKRMKDFYRLADFVHIDGMSLVLLCKLLGKPVNREHRVTYVDWIKPLMNEAAKNEYRVFFIGSKKGVPDKAADILKREYPNLQIETHHGYFDINSQENTDVIQKINNFQPHILMVGMGMPRQEYWILDNFKYLSANVILTAGACMDYVAGEVPTPPRWMGKLGLEWLYRLLSEPNRMWKRYLVEPWYLLRLFLREILNTNRKKS